MKVVDPRGEMLEASWEAHATALSNAESDEDLLSVVRDIIMSCKITLSKPAFIVYGYDTRPSCPALISALEDGLKCFSDVRLENAALKTTPQLHYLVKAFNTQSTTDPYGEPTEQGYYAKLAKAFKTLAQGRPTPQGLLTVDCANGVGAPKLKLLLEELQRIGAGDLLQLSVVKQDTKTEGALNNSCGADYVKTNQKAPPGITLNSKDRYASLDGDADRIVFYYQNADDNSFRLLDGDKIAGLAAMFIMDLVSTVGVDLSVGVVQTAYANGNSTAYLKKVLQVPVTCTPTGVKYLHHAAERFDVGVYFEANGHGTILFSAEALRTLKEKEPTSPAQQDALEALIACTALINQTVGDALSDLLFVEVILLHKQWGPHEWDGAYQDLPNRIAKVIVQDRNIFKTTDAERKLTEPKGLQAKVDAAVAKYQQGRSFVRPSGTEDCVRVYAEAATRAEADGARSHSLPITLLISLFMLRTGRASLQTRR